MHEIVRGLINWLVSALIEGTIAGAAELRDVEDVRTCADRVAQLSADAAHGSAQLKELLRREVYNSESLAEARRESVARISRLFDAYMADPALMPAPYREESADQPLHRQVCDYIAGMTDRFLLRIYDQMGIL